MSENQQQEAQENSSEERSQTSSSDLTRSTLSVLVERVDELISKHRGF